jgi:hypothetical protein
MERSPRLITGTINALLGLWLFVSAFLWPHEPAEFTTAWLGGMLVVTFALASVQGQSWGRLVVLELGCLLLALTLLTRPHTLITQRNHELVAAALIVLALIPERLRQAVLHTRLFRRQVLPK